MDIILHTYKSSSSISRNNERCSSWGVNSHSVLLLGIFCPKTCIISVQFFRHFSKLTVISRCFLKFGYFLSPNLRTILGTKNTRIWTRRIDTPKTAANQWAISQSRSFQLCPPRRRLITQVREFSGLIFVYFIFVPKLVSFMFLFLCHFSNFLVVHSLCFLKFGHFLSPNVQTNFGTKNDPLLWGWKIHLPSHH